MAIEKQIIPPQGELQEASPEMVISIENPDSVSIESGDGGVLIDFDPTALEAEAPQHDSNLADYMDDSDLSSLSSELISMYTSDRGSRKAWETTYTKGLKLLGLEIEEKTSPWPGACGVFHPVLTESVIRFQAHSIMETFPASGPVRTQILGQITSDKEKQAQRVESEMNYQITEVMTNYRAEHEQMLFNLPLAGSAFKKVYYDPDMKRADSVFVPAEDLVVAYGASDLISCGRFTHVMKKTSNEVKKLQYVGFYRDIDLEDPEMEYNNIQKAYDDIQGEDPSAEYDDRYTILEMHIDIELEGDEDEDKGEPTGIALPYIVSIDKQSGLILSVRRNWVEGDPLKKRLMHFVHYKYMPGLGFYGLGLIHMIGGMAKSATSLLRQLVDAGTLANLPAGLKSRGLRIKGDDSPISPGEFRDVDVPGGAIRDNITFIPYKEPSQTLFQLMTLIVEEARKYASIPDMQIPDAGSEAPVGTTLALMERSMKVMSAAQARLHAALKIEFNILARVIKDYLPPSYDYDVMERASRIEDFDDRIDVVPVSDPNATTMAQRITQYQAALQLAQQAPQMYDMPVLHRQMLETLGIKNVDKIIPASNERDPEDPVSENMSIINLKPVKAFEYQDHEAHITVHMTAMQDPKMQQVIGKSGLAQAIQASAESHIREHLAFEYRKQIEKQLGIPLPPVGEPLPEDVEKELAGLVSQAAEKLLRKDMAEAQLQQQIKQSQDPVVQQQNRELDIKEAEVQRKAEGERLRVQADLDKTKLRDATERDRIDAQREIAGANIGARIADKTIQAELKEKSIDVRAAEKGAEIGANIAREFIKKQ
tara:strand:+ start:860 stop:3328 length:2469 start_codon:yes stop_codon:yes gene_type:complete